MIFPSETLFHNWHYMKRWKNFIFPRLYNKSTLHFLKFQTNEITSPSVTRRTEKIFTLEGSTIHFTGVSSISRSDTISMETQGSVVSWVQYINVAHLNMCIRPLSSTLSAGKSETAHLHSIKQPHCLSQNSCGKTVCFYQKYPFGSICGNQFFFGF